MRFACDFADGEPAVGEQRGVAVRGDTRYYQGICSVERNEGRGAVKLEHVREFVALARCGSFQEAADRLYVARPTLSNHMRALEQELGFDLFDRCGSSELTDAGVAFLDGMERALEAVDRGLDQCRELASLQERRDCVVNISLRCSVFELRAALEKYCPCRYAFVSYDNKRPMLYPFTQDGADVMVMYDLDLLPPLRMEVLGMGLQYEPYGHEPCAIAMRENHPLVQGPLTRERLRGAEIAQLDVIESESWKRIIIAMLGDDMGLRFRLIPMDNLLNFWIVDLGDAVFISMKSMLSQYFARREGYVIRDLVDAGPLLMPRSLVYRPISERPCIAPVLDVLREHLCREGDECAK